MKTLVVGDSGQAVEHLIRILDELDGGGERYGTTSPEEALKLAERTPVDAAFLDIDIPGNMENPEASGSVETPGKPGIPAAGGIELAKQLQKISAGINLIFTASDGRHSLEAFGLNASDYLLKPVRREDVAKALGNLRYEVKEPQDVRVSCFGTFEVFVRGVPVHFPRTKSKELFAYLVDRRGASCTNDMIMGNLWPDEPVTESRKSLVRSVIGGMAGAFEALGVGDVIVRSGREISVNTGKIDCDYYRLLKGDPASERLFQGEYMSQYGFADETRAALQIRYLSCRNCFRFTRRRGGVGI